MATPPGFTFRLPLNQAEKLREVAKTYSDSGSTGVLLRDMVGAAISGDPQKLGEFNARLMDRLTNQMALQLVVDTKRKVRAIKKEARRAPRRR